MRKISLFPSTYIKLARLPMIESMARVDDYVLSMFRFLCRRKTMLQKSWLTAVPELVMASV